MELTEKERKRLEQYRTGLTARANVVRIVGLSLCFGGYLLTTILMTGTLYWWSALVILGFIGLMVLLNLPDYRMRLLVARVIDHALKDGE